MSVRPQECSLVGRERELATIDRALAGRARCVAVSGEPGIGKTRLLDELVARAEAAGWLVLAGRGAALEAMVPFGVIVDALDDHLAALEPRRLGAAGGPGDARVGGGVPRAGGAAGRAGGGPAGRALPHVPGRPRAARAAGGRAAGGAGAGRRPVGRRRLGRARGAPPAAPAGAAAAARAGVPLRAGAGAAGGRARVR